MCSAVFNGLAGEEDWCVFCLVDRVPQFWHWYFRKATSAILFSSALPITHFYNPWNMLSPPEIGTLDERCITDFKWQVSKSGDNLLTHLVSKHKHHCSSFQCSTIRRPLKRFSKRKHQCQNWETLLLARGWPSCNVVTMISTFLLCIQSQPEPAEIDRVFTILHHQHYVTWINAYLDTNWWYLQNQHKEIFIYWQVNNKIAGRTHNWLNQDIEQNQKVQPK